MTLSTSDRTAIDGIDKLSFVNSPVHIRLNNSGILSATIYLWCWSGSIKKVLGEPNQTLSKSLIVSTDGYISFEISQLLKSYLINQGNINQPTFAYNELSNPAITGQGMFWQIVADITTGTGTTRYNYNTQFATLGYLHNYEKNFANFSGFNESTSRYYNQKIHNYISQDFDFTKTVDEATTGNLISVTDITPTNFKCTEQPYLIVYLNKKGLFDMFTPYGKVVVSDKIEDEVSNIMYRDDSNVDNSYQHSKDRTINTVTQTYTINTGLLTSDMVDVVREILLSPKVYLIRFKGDTQVTTTVGITIDNTYITTDSINTTIDGLSIGEEYLSYYKTHQQIPVILKETDFTLKNRINDKSSIDYTLKFEETNSFIL